MEKMAGSSQPNSHYFRKAENKCNILDFKTVGLDHLCKIYFVFLPKPVHLLLKNYLLLPLCCIFIYTFKGTLSSSPLKSFEDALLPYIISEIKISEIVNFGKMKKNVHFK